MAYLLSIKIIIKTSMINIIIRFRWFNDDFTCLLVFTQTMLTEILLFIQFNLTTALSTIP